MCTPDSIADSDASAASSALVGNSSDPPQKNSESLYCIISYTVVSQVITKDL